MKNSIAVVLCAGVLLIVRETSANFLAYDDESTTNDPEEDYAQDEDQRRADYHDAIDRLISQAFNQTSDSGKPNTERAKVASDASGIDDDVKCAANRKVEQIVRMIYIEFLWCIWLIYSWNRFRHLNGGSVIKVASV